MSNQFVAEIRLFAGNFAPTGWALCNGQILPISQNTALFSLLGTTYGGDGKSTFALPNLQGSAPLQQGQGQGLSLRDLGQIGGAENVTLLVSEIPTHRHQANAVSAAGTPRLADPTNALWAASTARPYAPSAGGLNVQMSPLALAQAGSSFPHNNMPPYLALTFIIALQGIFPPRS